MVYDKFIMRLYIISILRNMFSYILFLIPSSVRAVRDHAILLKRCICFSPNPLHVGIFNQRLFSWRNLSHASLSVLNTAPAIIRCSVVAVVGIYQKLVNIATRLFHIK